MEVGRRRKEESCKQVTRGQKRARGFSSSLFFFFSFFFSRSSPSLFLCSIFDARRLLPSYRAQASQRAPLFAMAQAGVLAQVRPPLSRRRDEEEERAEAEKERERDLEQWARAKAFRSEC